MAKTPSTKVVSKKHIARLERERRQNKAIIIISAAVIVLVVLLIGYGYLNENVLKYRQPVAKVGEQSITLKDFQTQVRWTRYQLIQQHNQYEQYAQLFGSSSSYASYFSNQLTQIESQLNDPEALGSDVLDNMIKNLIIRQEAAKRGITVSTQEVDDAMHTYFGYYPNGTATPEIVPTTAPTSTLSPLQKTLVPPTATATNTATPLVTETSTPIPPTATSTPDATSTAESTPTIVPTETPYTADLYATNVADYISQIKETNIDEAQLRYLIENNLYYNKVRDAITADLKPEQEKVWARHILVADVDTANTVLEKLKAGGDFAQLAAEYSTDTGTKDNGGDLGWFAKSDMVQEFSDAAFALGIGEISDPVTSTYGVHIIQVLGHEIRPLSSTEFSTLKDNTLDEWLNTEMAKDTVKKYDTWKEYVPTDPALTATAN